MGVTRRVLCIDGNNILVRAIKALEGKSTMSADGMNTGPLLVFINCLSKYVRQVEPDRLVVCWDGGRSHFRTAVYPNYKGERLTVEEDDRRSHFTMAKEFLSLAGFHHVEIPHVEADDLVAHYWRIREKDHRFIILSSDKDFLQLLDGWTEQIRPGTGADEKWTANRVRTDLQCKPEHLPLVQALTGDKIDGVPGIPSFGPKTACKALAAHEWDMEMLLTTNDPKWGKKLSGHRENIIRNQKLVDLRTPPPIGYEIDLPPAPPFLLTTPELVLWDPLMDWLGQYRLEPVKERLVQQTLWVGWHRTPTLFTTSTGSVTI